MIVGIILMLASLKERYQKKESIRSLLVLLRCPLSHSYFWSMIGLNHERWSAPSYVESMCRNGTV
jgi:hypothetical protein